MLPSAHHPHDRFFRKAFSIRELMLEYVQEFLPSALAEKFDLETLEQQKESYLDKNLEQFFSDIVYTVRYGDSNVTVTLLLEHKSYVPSHPWLQLLQYLVNAYSAQANQEGNKGNIQPVIPIVIYHGRTKWKIREVSSYIHGVDDHLKVFIPEFRYLLNDLTQYHSRQLRESERKLVSHTFLTLTCSNITDESERTRLVIQSLIEAQLDENHENFFQFTIVYLSMIGLSRETIMKTISQIEPHVKDKVLSVYDQLIQEGIEKGMEKGMEKAAFATFKKGIAKNLSLDDLIDLTEIGEETARAWMILLKENPNAEFP